MTDSAPDRQQSRGLTTRVLVVYFFCLNRDWVNTLVAVAAVGLQDGGCVVDLDFEELVIRNCPIFSEIQVGLIKVCKFECQVDSLHCL